MYVKQKVMNELKTLLHKKKQVTIFAINILLIDF
jgi:hypothetical protein